MTDQIISHREIENQFIDLLEGKLDGQQRTKLESHLKSCEGCSKSWDQYRCISGLEKLAATQMVTANTDLSDALMAEIEECPQEALIPIAMKANAQRLVGSLLAANVMLVAILALMITGHHPAESIRENTGAELLAFAQSINAPNGYRAVTVELEDSAETGLLQAKRADLRYHVPNDNKAMTSTVVPYLKVATAQVRDIYGAADKNKTKTITLLIPEQQADLVNIALVTGNVSISPVSEPTKQEPELDFRPAVYTVKDPEGRTILEDAQETVRAVLYTPDPKTGGQVRRVYLNGNWLKDANDELQAF